MISGNYNLQYIDWSHDAVPGEPFKHVGNLVTNVISPTITIGLSDYFNISYIQNIGIRSMDWMGGENSDHHRDENTSSNFLNANGNIWGDSNIILRYLITNTGMISGSRIFLGSGLIIPSNSVLTINPYLKDDEGLALNEHRHFSLSDGVYKLNFELQFYLKNNSLNKYIPVFYGITYNYFYPLKENEYGFIPSKAYLINGTSLFKLNQNSKIFPNSISLGFIFTKNSSSYWNSYKVQNSAAKMYLPTIGFTWKQSKWGSLGLNIRYNNKAAVPEDAIHNKSELIEISVSYRYIFNYFIPWLE